MAKTMARHCNETICQIDCFLSNGILATPYNSRICCLLCWCGIGTSRFADIPSVSSSVCLGKQKRTIETEFERLLAFCNANLPMTSGFPSQRTSNMTTSCNIASQSILQRVIIGIILKWCNARGPITTCNWGYYHRRQQTTEYFTLATIRCTT